MRGSQQLAEGLHCNASPPRAAVCMDRRSSGGCTNCPARGAIILASTPRRFYRRSMRLAGILKGVLDSSDNWNVQI